MNGIAPSSPPVIVLENLVKFFGRFAAIRGISASFAPGRLYVVLGDNGAGKSTLLRIVAGLMEPSQGSFTLLGTKTVHAVARRVGYMGHAPLLYDELSGMENLRYFAGLYGIHDDDSRSRRNADGRDSIPNSPAALGNTRKGMRQRLSLARAVLHDPELMLLDEPFSNVDVRSARDMAAVLGHVRDQGKTIFVVTHQAPLMEGVADEFVHMAEGQIVLARTSRPPYICGFRGQDGAMSTLGVTRSTLIKDLRMEWRSKDAINSMLFFSLLVVVIFSFAFNPTAEESRRIAGGLIWVAFLFAAVVALNQTWARELRNQVLDAYRVSPAPPNALFLAKALGNFLFVVILEILMTPLFVVFYELRSIGPLWQLIVVALLGTWALVVNGTFFAGLSIRTRNREIMLPLLLFPITIPALLGMVDATTSILTGEASPDFWIKLLTVYDIVFTAICLLLFEVVLNAE